MDDVLWLALAFVSACLGFLYLMTAPAEGGRAAQWELLGIAKNIQRLFAAPQERMLVPLCAFAALIALCLLRRVDRTVLIAAGIYKMLVLYRGAPPKPKALIEMLRSSKNSGEGKNPDSGAA